VSTKNQTIKGFLIKNRVLLEAIIKCKEFAKPGKYDGGLTQGDVVYISDTLIKHDNWIKDHSQLFGFVKDKKSGLYLQTGSNAILDPNLFTGLNEIYSSTRNMEPKTGIEFGTPYQKRK
jgi:hypothetical protein